MQRELTYNKWVKYIHYYQLNKYKVKYTQKPAEKSGAMLLDELREQEYIMTDNQIIAEFMGYKVIYKPKVVNGENFFEYIDENGKYTYCHSLLRYNDKWDWLMPVVKKCFCTGDNTFEWDAIMDAMWTCDIKIVHSVLVEFINEYNKRK